MTTNELIDEFMDHVKRESGEPATIRFYTQRLKNFGERFGKKKFADLESLEIQKHFHKIGKKKNYSGTTLAHEITAMKTMQNFAIREGLIKKPVLVKILKPRVGRREKVPTPEEIELILQHAKPDFALLYRALMQTGARPGELCKVLIEEHIDWEAGEIVLKKHKTAKKTGKPRRISIGDKLEPLLRQAIGERTEGPVFLTIRGKAWRPAHASAEHRRLRNKAGLDKAIVLYSTRHRFGTRLTEEGLPTPEVAALMGHASIMTTQRYVHPDRKKLRTKQDLV